MPSAIYGAVYKAWCLRGYPQGCLRGVYRIAYGASIGALSGAIYEKEQSEDLNIV